MRHGNVLHDPISHLQVPPDIEIEDAELNVKADHAHGGKQHSERRQLNNPQPEKRTQFLDASHEAISS